MESRVIEFLTSSDNNGRSFRIFDFKRHIEVFYPGYGSKLLPGAAFDWRAGVPQNVA